MYFRSPPESGVSWGVVSTCLEPTPLVVAFVAHHVEMGAHRVHIFLDAPNPDTERLLAEIPECRVTVCSDDYWRYEVGRPRPSNTEARQVFNASRAFEAKDVDWLIHLDADEFLYCDRPMSTVLSAVPNEVDFMLFRNMERVFDATQKQLGLFDGVMRHPFRREWPAQDEFLSDDVLSFLLRGVAGHCSGKSVVRTDRPMAMGIHSPRRPGNPLKSIIAPNVHVLHFDGLTGLHWVSKLLRGWNAASSVSSSASGLGPARQKQIQFVEENGSEMAALFDLHLKVKTLMPQELDRLEALGMIVRDHIDPAKSIRNLGLSQEVSLSTWDYDALLDPVLPDFERNRLKWYRINRRYYRDLPDGIREMDVRAIA